MFLYKFIQSKSKSFDSLKIENYILSRTYEVLSRELFIYPLKINQQSIKSLFFHRLQFLHIQKRVGAVSNKTNIQCYPWAWPLQSSDPGSPAWFVRLIPIQVGLNIASVIRVSPKVCEPNPTFRRYLFSFHVGTEIDDYFVKGKNRYGSEIIDH